MANQIHEQNRIQEQDRCYRKGVLLGFTMAEIMLLIIFALLLSLTGLINKTTVEKETLENKLAESTEREKQLKEKVDKVLAKTSTKQEFDDFFKELTEVQEKAKQVPILQKKITQLQERSDTLTKFEKILNPEGTEVTSDQLKSISEKIDRLKKIDNAFKKLEIDPTDIDTLDKAIQLVAKVSSQKGFSKKELSSLISQNAKLNRQVKSVQGQNTNLRNKLKSLGNGLEMPPCWAEKSTGKPEYIFDVALTSDGLIVHDRGLTHRKEDKAELPLHDIVYDKEITPAHFMAEMKPLFEWSVKNECRFFVRAFDQTGANEKAIYKKHMKVLETRFYKYEVSSEAFPLSLPLSAGKL